MKRLAAFLLLAATIWYGLHMATPPAPKPADAPETEYSALRAFEHVQAISQAPHPLGTEEHARVREYLFTQLKKLGLQPEIHAGIIAGGFYSAAGHVQNIFARIPGSNPTRTIMLMAHYDTVPNSPGASDDGSGVSAILETVRALQAGEAPRNNVWILFTDGEERGLLGAEYFVENHPAADSVDLVMNVETRGSSGASLMFETSTPNRSLIPLFARSASHPVANSLTYTVYQMIPNDTDLSVTKEAGLGGLNFAYQGNHLDYHTMQDNPENISLASLQHHGENLLPVLRHLAATDFDLSAEGDMVYFNNLSGGLSYYPSTWSLPLALAALLLLIGWLVYLFRTGRLGWGRWLGSLLIFLLTVVAGGLITYFGFRVMAALHPQYEWLAYGAVYPRVWYLSAFSALMLALIAPVFSWMQRRWEMETPLSGVYTVWILLSTLAAWYLPTAAYLFTWPALLGLVSWIVLGDRVAERSWRTLGLLFLGLLAGLYMLPFYIDQVQVTLTTHMLYVSMAVLLLLAGLTWPWIHYFGGGQIKKWSGGLLLMAAACLAGASLNSGFDAEHKKQNSLMYLADMDTGEAHWVSRDHTTDAWTSQFLGENPSRDPIEGSSFLRGGAPMHAPAEFLENEQALSVNVRRDSLAAPLRHLTLILRGAGGHTLQLRRVDGNDLQGLRVNGVPVGGEVGSPRLVYYGNLDDSLEVSFAAPAADTLELEMVSVRPGFPASIMEGYEARANYMMPVPNGLSDVTLLSRRLRLDPR